MLMSSYRGRNQKVGFRVFRESEDHFHHVMELWPSFIVGFERATGYTVRISSFFPNCGIPMDYEVGPVCQTYIRYLPSLICACMQIADLLYSPLHKSLYSLLSFQTQTSLALESNETTHPFIARCIYTVQVR